MGWDDGNHWQHWQRWQRWQHWQHRQRRHRQWLSERDKNWNFGENSKRMKLNKRFRTPLPPPYFHFNFDFLIQRLGAILSEAVQHVSQVKRGRYLVLMQELCLSLARENPILKLVLGSTKLSWAVWH